MWTLPGYVDKIESLDWDAIYAAHSWVRDMRGVQQDPIHHSEGDVETHTKLVVKEAMGLAREYSLSAQERSILFAAALLHDVEKRSTTIVEDGRITSPRHAKRGEYTARSLIYRDHPAEYSIREQVCKLVRYHGLPIWAGDKPDPARSVIDASLQVNNKLLYLLAKADMLGRTCQDADDMLYRVEFFKELCMDNNCFNDQREFTSNLGRYKYLNEGGFAEFEPFDETKFSVTMMSGIPGSGKDTFISKQNLPVVSIDDIRRKHKVSPTDRSGNGRMVQIAKEDAKVHMRKKESFIWNATNITRDMRGQLIELFMSYGGYVKIVYVEVPYKELLKRNSEREFPLPVKAIDKMIDKLEIPSASEAHEIIII